MWREWQKCAKDPWVKTIKVIREIYISQVMFWMTFHDLSLRKWIYFLFEGTFIVFFFPFHILTRCHRLSPSLLFQALDKSSFFKPPDLRKMWRRDSMLLLTQMLTQMTGNNLCKALADFPKDWHAECKFYLNNFFCQIYSLSILQKYFLNKSLFAGLNFRFKIIYQQRHYNAYIRHLWNLHSLQSAKGHTWLEIQKRIMIHQTSYSCIKVKSEHTCPSIMYQTQWTFRGRWRWSDTRGPTFPWCAPLCVWGGS